MQEGPVSSEIINRVGGSRDTCCCNLICTRRAGRRRRRRWCAAHILPLQPCEGIEVRPSVFAPRAHTKFLRFEAIMKVVLVSWVA